MSQYEYIETQKGFFSSYWDTGIYGNYFKCDPRHVRSIMMHNAEAYAGSELLYLDYANRITDE